MNDTKYLQIPLKLLRAIHSSPEECILQMLNYGTYSFSKRAMFTMSDVCRQMLYFFYRKPSELPNKLRRAIEDNITFDEDYNGFAGDTFCPDINIEELEGVFAYNSKLYSEAIELYKMHICFASLGLSGTLQGIINSGKEIEKAIPKGEPMPSVSLPLIFKFYQGESREYDKLAMYIGVRSIIGKRPYARTNKRHIVARMCGYKSVTELPEPLPEAFCKYSKRYHFDRLMTALELNWGIITYGFRMRGLYVGTKDKISIDSLVLAAEGRKAKNRIERLRSAKAEARERALQHLNKATAS